MLPYVLYFASPLSAKTRATVAEEVAARRQSRPPESVIYETRKDQCKQLDQVASELSNLAAGRRGKRRVELVVANPGMHILDPGFLTKIIELNFLYRVRFWELPGLEDSLEQLCDVANYVSAYRGEQVSKGLKAARKHGARLGVPEGIWEGREKELQRIVKKAGKVAGKVHRDQARRALENELQEAVTMIKELHKESKSLRAIAEALNSAGIQTRRGRQWRAQQVSNVIQRLKEE